MHTGASCVPKTRLVAVGGDGQSRWGELHGTEERRQLFNPRGREQKKKKEAQQLQQDERKTEA
jgi:hypothetical protein